MMRPDRRGVALMLVLWALVVLSAVAASVAAATRDRSTLAMNLRARSRARAAAESGVLVARHRLERLLRLAARPEERALLFRELDVRFGDLEDVPLGDARFTVALADLSARLDLNHATGEMLVSFFSQFVDEERARFAAASLEDWKDRDDVPRPDGAEAAAYAGADSPYRPSNAPLARLEELPRVLGVGEALARRVAPYVTVHGDARVNLNTAPAVVLAALPGVEAHHAEALRGRVEDGESFGSSGALREVLDGLDPTAIATATTRSTVFPSRVLIVSRGWEEGHPLTYEIQAVYAVAREGLLLRDWKERER